MTGAGKGALTAVWLWIGLVLLLPFAIVLKISFATSQLGVPPYGPPVSFSAYAALIHDNLYLNAYLSSLRTAFVATVIALLLGYPMAYAIARARESTRNLLLMLIMLPFWTSFLLRVYAWVGLLKTDGVINNALLAAGLILSLIHI